MSAVATLAACERDARAAGVTSVADALAAAGARLGQPMRVAIAGQIKRGKSTLVNALLGEDVAPTAHLEATFTVSEFHNAPEPRVRVHYTDPARPASDVAVAEFRRYTVRDDAGALLDGVRRVEYGLPRPLLAAFRLVDTPGLKSVHGTDADNAASYLGLGDLDSAEQERLAAALVATGRSAGDVHRASAEELATADAVIYLFDRSINQQDLAAVSRFLGPLAPGMNATKAFGVLSRCDETYWPPSPDQPGDPDPLTWDPLVVANRIAANALRRPESRRMFFTIVPVAGLVGVAAATLTERDLARLEVLATVEPRRLVTHLQDAHRFATASTVPGVDLSPEERCTLIARLGAWGCLRSAGYLRDGVGHDELRSQLLCDSGVHRLRDTIVNHFGPRAAAIKLDHGLAGVSGTIATLRRAAARDGRPVPDGVDRVAGRVQDMRSTALVFRQLSVLSALYNDELALSSQDVEELLRVTGERGLDAASRLGAAPDSGLAELEQHADRRIEHWARVLGNPTLDGPTREAARVVLRSVERVAGRVRGARRLLETDDDAETAVSGTTKGSAS